jgi:hypothetical protein
VAGGGFGARRLGEQDNGESNRSKNPQHDGHPTTTTQVSASQTVRQIT